MIYLSLTWKELTNTYFVTVDLLLSPIHTGGHSTLPTPSRIRPDMYSRPGTQPNQCNPIIIDTHFAPLRSKSLCFETPWVETVHRWTLAMSPYNVREHPQERIHSTGVLPPCFSKRICMSIFHMWEEDAEMFQGSNIFLMLFHRVLALPFFYFRLSGDSQF